MSKQILSIILRLISVCALLAGLVGLPAASTVRAKSSATVNTLNPIMFVTQFPIRDDFTTIGSVFGNHLASMQSAGRGGDLYIRYPGGTLKNLTKTAGYGSNNPAGAPAGFQDHNAIAVRDPAVYWDGTKALFSMVIGAPDYNQRYEWQTYHWQIYEITGLGQTETPVITKVPNQPANFNNVSPIYGSDDRIIFTSDRPRNGAGNLYPQLDEYEEAPTVTGLWSLDPVTGDLFMLNHAPSGDFSPILDSFGRVLFTQWDHMQRDQQADADKFGGGGYGTFNWTDEGPSSIATNSRTEIYPEPRAAPEALPNLNTLTFNQFFPWQINEDGSSPETINHIGRHELVSYISNSFTNDPNVVEYYGQFSRFNTKPINNLLQIAEDPAHLGTYFGVDAPEFRTHAAGQVVKLTAPPSLDADHIAVTYVTHRDTEGFTNNPSIHHSGHYRDPLPLSNGMLVAAHTANTDQDYGGPIPSTYNFRLKTLTVQDGIYYKPDQLLTAGISKTIKYWDPDNLVSYTGKLWELQPVEVVARTRPTPPPPALGAPEQAVFTAAGVDVTAFQNYMKTNNLALIVSHNVTTRDDFDRQQPFNLRIPGGTQTLGPGGGKIYDIKFLQIFQADQLRGMDGPSTPSAGRRVIAQLLHDPNARLVNPWTAGSPLSSVTLGADGSMAAFVPARRAMTWQLVSPTGASVVRERFWLTFQPGEIRVCASCHGVNDKDQAGNLPPTNQPQALMTLLQHWQGATASAASLTLNSEAARDGFVLESAEGSSVGGTLNSASALFYAGDDGANRQYRGVLHFDTSGLPDTAVITSVTLKLKKQGQVGTNPFATHGVLRADIRNTFFSTAMALQAADFQAGASNSTAAVFDATPAGGWYNANLDSAGFMYINRTGPTQFRLRFNLDDNNDHNADYLAFYSGDAPLANQPQLVITYYVP